MRASVLGAKCLTFLAFMASCSPAPSGPGGIGGAGGAGGAGSSGGAGAWAETYADIVEASYADSVKVAEALAAAVKKFVAEPTEKNLGLAREAWLAAREPYLQTEVYRFYEGPVDEPESGPEGLINAWPLDEAYIDSVEEAPESGLINTPEQELSAETLRGLNEQGGEKNIATGYHAIEFLLWGQDLAEDGPGNRPASDYDPAENASAQRRGQYLTIVSDMLVSDLKFLQSAWVSGKKNYRAEFLEADADEALRRAMTGLIVLSGMETGGERIQPALDTGDQEDEHSCFSDNTHRDFVGDVKGVQNVYLGHYVTLSGEVLQGPGVKDRVAEVDAELADRIEDAIAESLARAEALEPPFDQEIRFDNPEGRARVQALLEALRDDLEPLFEEAFRKLELPLITE